MTDEPIPPALVRCGDLIGDERARRAEMKEAKRRLYAELLRVPHGEMTATEIELGYQLALDPQIQELLNETLRAERGSSPSVRISNDASETP